MNTTTKNLRSLLPRFLPLLSAVWLSVLLPSVQAQELSHMSIEELIGLDVTSVSKKTEKASQVSAALFVLTQEDIRRSGASSIPEVLRLVPGVQVDRIDANSWSITIRGFNNQFANKLLVLIDGRTSYTPLFSGVFWDVQDTLMSDIERIEVIRGPGATLWGANAVNGVINIITKNAADTQGLHVSASTGTSETAIAEARYGGEILEATTYRAFLKYSARDDFDLKDSNESADDSWKSLRAGFRSDSEISDTDSFSVIADAYRNEKDQSFSFGPIIDSIFPDEDRVDEEDVGVSLLARWTRSYSPFSELQVQSYYEYVERDDTPAHLKRNTYDLDTQFRFPLFDSHDILIGAGWRLTEDGIGSTTLLTYEPKNRSQRILSAFIQDDISLIEDVLTLTLGTKLEEHTFTGLEIQPNARMSWSIDESSNLWGAISRAVRTPSRTDESASFLSFEADAETSGVGLPVLFSGRGNGSLDAENLTAFEIGYRKQISEQLAVDLTGFYYYYNDIVSSEANSPIIQPPLFGPSRIDIVFDVANNLSAEAHGFEAVAEYRPLEQWRLIGSYSFLSLNLYGSNTTDTRSRPDGFPLFYDLNRGSPEHLFGLRSLYNISADVEFDSSFRYVDDHFANRGQFDLDIRLGWQVSDEVELSLVGQNLIEGEHVERIQPQYGQPVVDIPRSAYIKAVWRY